MTVSQQGVDLIKGFEGLELEAYKDIAGIPTIGYGATQYEDGTPVKMGDVITLNQAETLISIDVARRARNISEVIGFLYLTQNQFDALVSLAYNIGLGAFKSSTVLKRVRANRNDPTIKDAFLMWNKTTINGEKKVSPGLVNRRTKEAEYYFST